MKKVIYLLTLGVMFSCSSEEESQLHVKSGLTIKSDIEEFSYGLANPGTNMLWDINRPFDEICYSTGGECLPDVIITVDKSDDCDEVLSAVFGGDVAIIKGTFKKHRNFLLGIMEIGIVDGVITENLYVKYVKKATKTYLTFYHKSTGNLAAVYPILK